MIDVKIDKFQGPLSLLLQIIEKEELDITTVNLAKIANEYLDYVKSSSEILPESMADFLLMAAKLLFIKSKALLPYLFSEEDQEEVDDLAGKLKMYKDFVDLSLVIQKIIGKKKFSFFRQITKNNKRFKFIEGEFFSPKNVNPESLKDEFAKLLSKVEKVEEKLESRVIIPEISIEERIFYIRDMVSQKIKINFTRIFRESKSRTEIIVNFLAILELAKQREIIFNQDDLFGDIFIEHYKELIE